MSRAETERVQDFLFSLVDYKHPERFRDQQAFWVKLFRTISLSPESRVVELGPGISPKILFALSSFGFKGTFEAVDLDLGALEKLAIVNDLLNPPFSLETHAINLFDFDYSRTDLVIGNHLVDNLVAEEYSRMHKIDYKTGFKNPIFQRDFWGQVKTERETAERTVTRLADKLMELNTGSWVAFNQYESNFERKHELGEKYLFCLSLLHQLSEALFQRGFEKNEDLFSGLFRLSSEFRQEEWVFAQKI